jgi:hypothetical protein
MKEEGALCELLGDQVLVRRPRTRNKARRLAEFEANSVLIALHPDRQRIACTRGTARGAMSTSPNPRWQSSRVQEAACQTALPNFNTDGEIEQAT